MNEKKEEKGYQGWANYETWVAKLWLDNDKESYNHLRELTRKAQEEAMVCPQVKDGMWTIEEAKKFILADSIREKAEMIVNETGNGANLASDLFQSAFEKIDFDEIAEDLLSE